MTHAEAQLAVLSLLLFSRFGRAGRTGCYTWKNVSCAFPAVLSEMGRLVSSCCAFVPFGMGEAEKNLCANEGWRSITTASCGTTPRRNKRSYWFLAIGCGNEWSLEQSVPSCMHCPLQFFYFKRRFNHLDDSHWHIWQRGWLGRSFRLAGRNVGYILSSGTDGKCRSQNRFASTGNVWTLQIVFNGNR